MRAAPFAFAALLASCKYAELRPEGAAVQAVTQPPSAECRNLGVVAGKGGGGFGELVSNEKLLEHATNDALNQAGERGATHLVLMAPSMGSGDRGATSSAMVTGVAYRCPGAAPASAPASAAAAAPARWDPAVARARTPVRSAPDQAAPVLFLLEPGARIAASPAATRGFRQVRAEDGRGGYVEAAQLEPASR